MPGTILTIKLFLKRKRNLVLNKTENLGGTDHSRILGRLI